MSFYNDSIGLNKLLELEISNSLTNIQKKHERLHNEYKLLDKQNKDLTNYIMQTDENSKIEQLKKMNKELREECDALKRRLNGNIL